MAKKEKGSPVWIVSEGYLRAKYPFGATTGSHIEMSPEVSIEEAMAFLALRPRRLFCDPQDRLRFVYLRDLRPAGLVLGEMEEADLTKNGWEWPRNNYLILPPVRDPKFPNTQRDYRMRLFAMEEGVRLYRAGRKS